MVRRHNKPRGMFRTATGERCLLRRRVVVPVGSLLVIGLADLPSLGGIVEPILESPQLLLLPTQPNMTSVMAIRCTFAENRLLQSICRRYSPPKLCRPK